MISTAIPRLSAVLLALTSANRAGADGDGLQCSNAEGRPRIVVLTDISSLEAGVAEPDDGQSLIRLLLYANEFDIEGLVATSNLGHGQKVRPDLIHRAIDAYERDRPNLLLHDDRYPPAGELRARVKAGQPRAGEDTPAEESIGPGKDTEGSEWIIRMADRDDPRPLWVLIWGGSADLAQAIRKVRDSRTPEQSRAFQARLRVHAIGDQDSTGPWIRANAPNLRTITQRRAYRGIYRGGDEGLSGSRWVREHIKGHGALGDLYPDYDGGDIWSGRLGPVRGIKEGDTPSFLSLVPNGLSDPGRPELGSWGGRFRDAGGGRLEDIPDRDLDAAEDPDPRMSSVYRWRPDFQADFRARLDWCSKPRGEANHPPCARIAGDRERAAAPGDVIELDAGASTDPDGDPLSYSWSIYPALEGGDAPPVAIEGAGKPRARIKIAPAHRGRTIPVLLTARDGGRPPLARYARVLIRVGGI